MIIFNKLLICKFITLILVISFVFAGKCHSTEKPKGYCLRVPVLLGKTAENRERVKQVYLLSQPKKVFLTMLTGFVILASMGLLLRGTKADEANFAARQSKYPSFDSAVTSIDTGSVWKDEEDIQIFIPLVMGNSKNQNVIASNALIYVLGQRRSGSQFVLSNLFQSYDDGNPIAHTFDQALVLRTLTVEMEKLERGNPQYEICHRTARGLVDILIQLQHEDGSWWNAYNFLTGSVTNEQGNGVMAWVAYALADYSIVSGEKDAYEAAKKTAEWLEDGRRMKEGAIYHNFGTQGEPVNIWVTEDNIDAWFAFYTLKLAAGFFGEPGKQSDYQRLSEGVKNYLLTRALGSFSWQGSGKSGRSIGGYYFTAGINADTGLLSDSEPYLDNQAWGSIFLKAIGENNKALQILAFARNVFYFEDENGFFGLDSRLHKDTLEPMAINWEFTSHYIAAAGEGAQNFLYMLNLQQRAQGGYPHDSEDIGGEYWHTTATGVNVTSWAFAVNCNDSLLQAPFEAYNVQKDMDQPLGQRHTDSAL